MLVFIWFVCVLFIPAPFFFAYLRTSCFMAVLGPSVVLRFVCAHWYSQLCSRKGDVLYCELGSPPLKEMIGIKIYGTKWPPSDGKLPGDPRSCSFERYGRMSEFSTFKQLKKKIMNYYEFASPGTEYVRVRLVAKDSAGYYRPSFVFNNQNYNKSLKNLQFFDDIVVAVQVLKTPDHEQSEIEGIEDKKTQELIYLTIRKRNCSDKRFEKTIEIAFTEESLEDMDSFKKEIAKHYSSKVENMIFSKFDFDNKKWINFFGGEEDKEKKTLTKKYFLKDGDVIIFKDVTEDPKNEDPFYEHVILPDEKETYSHSWSRPKSPEKQLKIEYERDDD